MHEDVKRQNFNVNADQAADLEAARVFLNAPTIKDAMLRAARLVNSIARELRSGKKLVALDESGQSVRIMIPELEAVAPSWTYLCERAHPWRKQLYVKGRKLLASTIWIDMTANKMTPEEAASDRDLPLGAVLECIRYSEQNLDLIRMEAQEEKQRLVAAGLALGA